MKNVGMTELDVWSADVALRAYNSIVAVSPFPGTFMVGHSFSQHKDQSDKAFPGITLASCISDRNLYVPEYGVFEPLGKGNRDELVISDVMKYGQGVPPQHNIIIPFSNNSDASSVVVNSLNKSLSISLSDCSINSDIFTTSVIKKPSSP